MRDATASIIGQIARQKKLTAGLGANVASALIGEKLVKALAPTRGLLFHGCGLRQGRSIMVFLADSGGGKSTLLDHSKKGRCIHDDKMAVFRADEGWRASGVPMLDNKGKWGRVIHAPLKALCLIEKAKRRCLEKLSPREAFPEVARFAIEPTGTRRIRKLISQTLMELVAEAPVYRLGYVLGDDVSGFL